jgi:3-hydroxyacyl-CoA dehydrogenase
MKNAAVIGAGVMGAGIAAQLADAGLSVTLLDLDTTTAEGGLARQINGNGFADPAAPARIRTGSSLSDLAALTSADWIIEAASERIDVKQRLFAAIDAVRKPGSIVSSNTSTILRARLIEGMPPSLSPDFLITHFFNPPRWMRLLELVSGPENDPAMVTRMADFAEQRLGKSVVRCRDTPGFLANRIGNFWMAAAVHEAVAHGLEVEEADAVLGKPFGAPTGVFALLDLVGIDLVPVAWHSLQAALPAEDMFQTYTAEPPLIVRMIAEGQRGRKAGAGFMRRLPDGSFETLDLIRHEYRPTRSDTPMALDHALGDLRAILTHPSPAGRYAAAVWSRTLAYAASLVPAVAASADPIDRAMRYGYGWALGPFELIERIGAEWLAENFPSAQ